MAALKYHFKRSGQGKVRLVNMERKFPFPHKIERIMSICLLGMGQNAICDPFGDSGLDFVMNFDVLIKRFSF